MNLRLAVLPLAIDTSNPRVELRNADYEVDLVRRVGIGSLARLCELDRRRPYGEDTSVAMSLMPLVDDGQTEHVGVERSRGHKVGTPNDNLE